MAGLGTTSAEDGTDGWTTRRGGGENFGATEEGVGEGGGLLVDVSEADAGVALALRGCGADDLGFGWGKMTGGPVERYGQEGTLPWWAAGAANVRTWRRMRGVERLNGDTPGGRFQGGGGPWRR
ncbi:putative pollen-specific leucine-rich repeat extensin-like protein 3 [Iris pallida]|uniref:Pollen-specific leucine-rich repeat extensin-like protein 3 n=1 Tax=Iris pallida TaxID=29817 RepID=A0AAX6FHP0_IRIPA|nr:putative pollen-specific leucine-rich repeat extensin-like protein 3 [Iris pallida]